MNVDDGQVVDGEAEQQEKAEDVRPDVHSFIRPPEYAGGETKFEYLGKICYLVCFGLFDTTRLQGAILCWKFPVYKYYIMYY